MYCKVSELSVLPDSTIREAIACIDKHYRGIVLVTDRQGNLLGTITDGDIRRAMLSGRELQDTVNLLLSSKTGTHYSKPVTARIGDDEADILRLMQEHVVHQVPLIDENGHVADLVTIQDLLPGKFQSVQAVIMAGGAVSRLHPLTDDLPKPMLPIGGRPLLELTIAQLRRAGINHVNLTTHYKSDVIMKHFGDGKEFGVDIDYLDEHEPQGTVGALRMLEKTDEPVLVMNGDVLTRVDFRAMLEFHREQQADMTVAVRMHEFRIPYGVIESTGDLIRSVSEKPVIRRMINAGIYLLNPDLLKLIPEDGPYAMTDLINRLSAEGRRVISFPIHEYWLDIKEYEDYQRVLTDVKNGVFGDLSTITMRSEPGAPVPAGFIPLCVPELAGNEWAYIKECLDTNWVSSVGPFVDHFEKMVAEYAGLKYGISANSGTAALHIALLVAGVQPDDEVIVSTLTFIAPVNAVRYIGAWPVLIDAEPAYWQMDVERLAYFLDKECQYNGAELRNKITGRRVKAIVPVHILGHPVDMDPLMDLARKYGLVVVEDATESLGAKYKGKLSGSLGDIACFSFNGNKVITTGGGGMVVTDNETWARRAKYLTTQAKDDPLEYIHGDIGYNYRLTNIQAAMGCAQMEQLDQYIADKRRISEIYSCALSSIPGISVRGSADWAYSIEWMHTILVDPVGYGMDSRELLRKLGEAKVQTRPLWQPIHLSPVYRSCQVVGGDVAERLNRMALSLPSSVGLTEEQQQHVIRLLELLRRV